MSYERFTIDELQRFGLTGDDTAIMALGRRCLELEICEDKDVAQELKDAIDRADDLEDDISRLERDIEIKDEYLEKANEKARDLSQQRDELLAALKKLIDKEFAYVDNKLAGGQIDMYDVWGARRLISKVEGNSDA